MGIVATIAALYFGRAIFLPLATAVLLTFALVRHLKGEQLLRHCNVAGHQRGQMNRAERLVPADAVRRQADRVVDEFPHDALEILAADMVSGSYEEEGLDISVAIAAELLRRAAAGVRKWPRPKRII